MNAIYLSIEKDIEVFEYYKNLWGSRGITGIRADTMTEGIEKAIAVESSTSQYLYFVDIVADDVDYMPQLAVMNREIDAPILIATSCYDEDEHHKALSNGAHFYGEYCNDPEKNITAVKAAIESYHRAKNQKLETDVLTCGRVLISISEQKTFVDDMRVELTYQEFELLHTLMMNKGIMLSYEQIYLTVWKEDYNNDAANAAISKAIERLRKKIKDEDSDNGYIKNKRGFGYIMSAIF